METLPLIFKHLPLDTASLSISTPGSAILGRSCSRILLILVSYFIIWVFILSFIAPVCTTELGQVAKLKPEFDKRNTKVIGLSVDKLVDHLGMICPCIIPLKFLAWSKDIEETQGCSLNFPIIADFDRKVSIMYDMLDQPSNDASNVSTQTSLPLTVRSVFFIDPSKKIRLMLTYPAAVGRDFNEILRCLDALQLADQHKIATPANWRSGDDGTNTLMCLLDIYLIVIVRFDLSNEEAKEIFPDMREVKPYLRYTKCPNKL